MLETALLRIPTPPSGTLSPHRLNLHSNCCAAEAITFLQETVINIPNRFDSKPFYCFGRHQTSILCMFLFKKYKMLSLLVADRPWLNLASYVWKHDIKYSAQSSLENTKKGEPNNCLKTQERWIYERSRLSLQSLAPTPHTHSLSSFITIGKKAGILRWG